MEHIKYANSALKQGKLYVVNYVSVHGIMCVEWTGRCAVSGWRVCFHGSTVIIHDNHITSQRMLVATGRVGGEVDECLGNSCGRV